MRRILESFRRSLSAKLSIWIVLFTAIILLATLFYSSLIARRYVKVEAVQRASQVLDNSVLKLTNILEDVKLSADNLEWLVYRNLEHPELMMD